VIVDLPDTTTTDVSKALVTLRHSVGAMAMGRVLTLLVSTDQAGADDALACANEATRQPPGSSWSSRTMAVPTASTLRSVWGAMREPARSSCCACTAACASTPTRS
jgi:hypothetical protein